MAVTLNDVARRAGVSKSTVSNVVRGATPVSPVTRRRVEAAISELGYRPDEVARALKQRATRTLGLVITDTVNPFAASLAQAVVRRARRDGYAVLIADTDGDQAYVRFQGLRDTKTFPGTFEYTGGTGKYKGISGSNTFVAVTQVSWTDGTASGYATWNR